MGEASIRNELLHREPLRRRALLRQDGTHACELLFRKTIQCTPIKHNLARIAAVQPRKCAQEGGLARTVRADDGCAPPRLDVYVQTVQNFLARNLCVKIAGKEILHS